MSRKVTCKAKSYIEIRLNLTNGIGDTTFTDYDCFIVDIIGREVDAGSAQLVLVDGNQR